MVWPWPAPSEDKVLENLRIRARVAIPHAKRDVSNDVKMMMMTMCDVHNEVSDRIRGNTMTEMRLPHTNQQRYIYKRLSTLRTPKIL